MKVLIQRKTILLSLLILSGLLSISCYFLLPKDVALFEEPTETQDQAEESLSETVTALAVTPHITETPMPLEPTPEPSVEETITATFEPTRSPTLEPTAEPTIEAALFDPAKLGGSDLDVLYCTANDGTELLMDIYYPETKPGPWPVMMFVHGGGWTQGSKENSVWPQDAEGFGLLVVTINYRLSPRVKFPAHIEDVKCAVRYLRANAATYNIDPDRFLAYGASAGGHLVSLLGVTGDTGEFNTGEYLTYSSAVTAVIAQSAPTDFPTWNCDFPGSLAVFLKDVFDSEAVCGDKDPRLIIASPVSYVSSGDVPFLFLAGTADTIVPYQQSEIMHQALLNAGVSSELLLIEDGKHSLVVKGESGWRPIIHETIDRFIITQLGLDIPLP